MVVGESLSGVIILYNPDKDVIGNITSYLNTLSCLYVIDNSESIDKQIVDSINTLGNKIKYLSLGGNLGVATALNTGCNMAYEAGYKWILTMDQDSSIDNGFFDIAKPLLSDFQNAIIAASYNSFFYKPEPSIYPGFISTGTVITSANLLNLGAWKSLSGFCEKFFIDEVDNEFCIRAIKAGYKIQATKNIYLKHNLGIKYFKKNIITRQTRQLTTHSPARVYYMTRNNLFLWKKYIFTNPGLIFNRIKNLIRLVGEVTFYYPDRITYYKYIAKGTYDFLISKYGRI
ncbi:rhamnosyltransferase [Mucilaginibacter mallensis]|uniref:Rhamnosyltransferase n=1 Tax=Mucilaginibacter mallensis TaxID=652787 RepID=A0A1H1YMQ5_MUCMA|nr:glycosyltransferase [Mucilaginibacter mallensis]SDT22645.1 rhamnosyltransferase [Mucilaginibacter mallensis]